MASDITEKSANNLYYSFHVSLPPYGKKNYIWSILNHDITQCSCGTKHYTVSKGSPILFEYDDVNKIADGIFCGDVHDFFYVSKKTKEVFENAKITGISFERVQAFHQKRKELHPLELECYRMIVDTEKEVELDYKAMHLKRKNVCPICDSFTLSRHRIFETMLKEETISDKDIIRVQHYRKFICTQKVVDTIRDNKLKGFEIKEVSKLFLAY